MFVDDVTSGGSDEEVLRFKGNEDPETLACDGTMSEILDGGSFILKAVALTRRILLGVTNSQFDMLGIASPLNIKMKTGMRDSFIKEDGLDWDTVLPDKLRDMWVNYMEELVDAGQLEFRRCVRPEGEILEFILVAYFDGSDQAYAAVIYCRWLMGKCMLVCCVQKPR